MRRSLSAEVDGLAVIAHREDSRRLSSADGASQGMPSALVETPDCFIYLQAFVRSAIMALPGEAIMQISEGLHTIYGEPEYWSPRPSLSACLPRHVSRQRGDFAFGRTSRTYAYGIRGDF